MKHQKGIVQYLYLIGAAAVLASYVAVYFYGKHVNQEEVDAAALAQKVKDDAAAEAKRKENVANMAKVVMENLALQDQLGTLTNQLKIKPYVNETANYCKAAPAGSLLLTPDRLRDLAAIAKSASGVRK